VKGYGLFFYIAEAFRGLRTNSIVNLLALGTITMIMLIVGFFLLVFFNLQSSVQVMAKRLEVSVYLKEGLTEHEKDFLQSRLKAEPGIRKVTYLSKVQALDVFKKELKGQEALLDGLGQNPLPDSYEVMSTGPMRMPAVLKRSRANFPAIPALRTCPTEGTARKCWAGCSSSSPMAARRSRAAGRVGVFIHLELRSSRALLARAGDRADAVDRGHARFILGSFSDRRHAASMLGSTLSIGILAGLYYALPHEAVLFLSHTAGIDFLPLPVVPPRSLAAVCSDCRRHGVRGQVPGIEG